ncbi:hypothetical protein EDB89DRAFT_2248760 [Lactarius sanguifluus]|nr:hypothetical protein EDB89DRAFT_2248760 [Lactarius sanguifluus]
MATGKVTTAIQPRQGAVRLDPDNDHESMKTTTIAHRNTTTRKQQQRYEDGHGGGGNTKTTTVTRRRPRRRRPPPPPPPPRMTDDNSDDDDSGDDDDDGGGGGQSHSDGAAGLYGNVNVKLYIPGHFLRVVIRVAVQTKANKGGHAGGTRLLSPFCPLPPFVRNGGAGQETRTPPPPLGSRAGEGPPPVRAQWGHDRTHTRGTSPATAAPAPVCTQGRGGAGMKCGTGQDTRRGTAQGKARATPLPPSYRGPRALCQRQRDGPSPLASTQRQHANKGRTGGREWAHPPHPLRPAAICMRAGRAPTWSSAPSPRVGVREQRPNRNVQSGPPLGGVLSPSAVPPPLPRFAPGKNAHGRRRGTPLSRRFARKGERERPRRSDPPFPGFAPGRNGQTRMGGSVEPPCLSRRFARTGERERAATQKRPPLPPGSRARAKRHAEVPPSPVCTPGARGPLLARYPHLST